LSWYKSVYFIISFEGCTGPTDADCIKCAEWFFSVPTKEDETIHRCVPIPNGFGMDEDDMRVEEIDLGDNDKHKINADEL
jgi:hypothetical protein